MTPQRLAADLKARASALGFDVCRIASASGSPEVGERLADWLADGRHGDMDWMANTAARRMRPSALWPLVRSCVMVGVNYTPAGDALAATRNSQVGAVSVYARARDYHDVLKGRLKQLGGWIAARGVEVKVFVDTAPVMEKPLAQQAGLGWQGKHTNLVSREFGSWLFLGALFTDVALPADPPERDHCGSCRACLDACPTQAFPAPYQLDARRCISYLTIEHKGAIPVELRAGIGNRIYGCDDCLAVCPWNKFAHTGRETKLTAPDWRDPPLAELAALDDAGFRARFAGGPIKRIGHARFLRNVLVAIGNSGDAALLAAVRPHLEAAAPLVRGAAVWAFQKLAPDQAAVWRRDDPDPDVAAEWTRAV